MTRRGFLGVLAGAAFALDPERALWVRGAKLISVPAASRVFLVEPVLTDPEWLEAFTRAYFAVPPVPIGARRAVLERWRPRP